MKNVKTSISPYEYPPSFGLIRTAIKSVWLSANGTVEALRAEARPIAGKQISCLLTTSERYPGARFHQNICCLVPRGCSILVALRFTPPPLSTNCTRVKTCPAPRSLSYPPVLFAHPKFFPTSWIFHDIVHFSFIRLLGFFFSFFLQIFDCLLFRCTVASL